MRFFMLAACAAALAVASAGASASTAGRPVPLGDMVTVNISGPTLVKPNTNCVYFATPSGGTAPYTYSWSATGSATGTTTDNEWLGSSPSSFTLSVTVTDANGQTASDSHSVTVSSSARICPV